MRPARSFGTVAALYDRHRPRYPAAVFDAVVGDGDVVLEVGAGTGIATVELAARSRRVDAVEPDPEMAALARERCAGLAVEVHESTFERYDAVAGAYDVVASAQAWHWVDLDRGYPRAASALAPGGRLAVWWNRPGQPSGPAWDAVQAAYRTHAPGIHKPPDVAGQRRREAAFAAGPGFTAWDLHRWEWTRRYDAATYVGYVRTHSRTIGLEQQRRDRLLDAIAEGLGDAILDHPYVTVLAVASKRD